MKIGVCLLAGLLCASACSLRGVDAKAGHGADKVLILEQVERKAIFEADNYYTWGASPVKGKDGKYHLYYARWEKKYGFLAWVTHSEIAHAVADAPEGPYTFSDVALPTRGEEYWDGLTTHNPTIHIFNDKYYLYYMGTTGQGPYLKEKLNMTHRNNQRIGVAVADSPYGPWSRYGSPLINVSADSLAHDALMVSNPSVLQKPDGSFLMVYKAVGKRKPGVWGGPVVHLCATANTPAGPFTKHPDPVFTAGDAPFPAEDPYIWYQDSCCYAIVKDMHGSFTNVGRSLALFYSTDGIQWAPVKQPLISVPELKWDDGQVTLLKHLERPQLLFDEENKPIMLFVAADSLSDNLGGYAENGHSFNVHIRLK